MKLRALINDWVQEGFQEFFRKLDRHFLLLSGKINSTGQDQGLAEATQKDKITSGLVVVLAQLSVFIEQSAIPRITEVSSLLMFPIMFEVLCPNIIVLFTYKKKKYYCPFHSQEPTLNFHLQFVRK